MVKPLRLVGEMLGYGLFAAMVGFFAVAPAYSPIESGHAVVTLSFAHSGQRLADCRERTPEELAKLPPNMRAPMECSRERSPVDVRFAVDGDVRYARTLKPSGLSRDGTSYVYAKIEIPAGRHDIDLALDDDIHRSGGAYEYSAEVDLQPYQILVIDFDPNVGFVLH